MPIIKYKEISKQLGAKNIHKINCENLVPNDSVLNINDITSYIFSLKYICRMQRGKC